MPKLSSLVSLSTAGKVAGGVMLGGLSTVAVQRHTDSSEFSKDPQRAEMREEQKKKLDFEVQQRSEELEKKEQALKALEATLAKQQAALTEERLAVQQMKTSATEVAASEAAVVETVQQVAQTEEPTDVQPEKPKADVVPTDNTPKRPAVFDGGGNKEKPVATTNKNNASEPSVAFGSSGDVVTVEKGSTVPDAETERLRKEVEDLRRRLAQKDERLLVAERRYKLKRLGSDEDDAFAESDAFGFDPSDDKKKVRGKYMKRIKNDPIDFQITKQEYSVSANPTKGSGVATTKTPVSTPKSTQSTPKPAVVDAKEELKNIEELFNNGTVKNRFLGKDTVENIKRDLNENSDSVATAAMNRENMAETATINIENVVDNNGYSKAFFEQFPEFKSVKSYGFLKNLAGRIVDGINHLESKDKDARKILSREEVFEALQRSVKGSGARYLKEKMQPPSIDPELRAACENERKAYRGSVPELTTVGGHSDPEALFEDMKGKAKATWRNTFDEAGLLAGKRDILQGWFDLCDEMDALDFQGAIGNNGAGSAATVPPGVPNANPNLQAHEGQGDDIPPPPPPPPPPGILVAPPPPGVPGMVPVVEDNAVWIKGRGTYELPSKKLGKGVAMPKFKGSASAYGLRIIDGLREFDPKFKQIDDSFQKGMKEIWKNTEPTKGPGKTKDDKDYEDIAKRRDEVWGRYLVDEKYYLLGLQYSVCSRPKLKEKVKDGEKELSIERLDLPKYDDVKQKVDEISKYLGSFDLTNPLDELRARIFGLLRDENKDALKNACLLAKRFMDLIGSMEKMRVSYQQKKSTYEASQKTGFTKDVSNGLCSISLQSLESLDSDKLYKILSENVHKIRSLEIQSVGKNACFGAFGRFLKLCRSMDRLKTLKITAPWGVYAEPSSFFNPKNSIKGSTLTPLDPEKTSLTNEEQLLAAIAIIPNLEEIHLLRKATTSNASLPRDSFEHYWAAIGKCNVVELPIFDNGGSLVRRICQSDDLKTKKRHFIFTAYEGTSISEKLSEGFLETVGQLLVAGEGKITVQFDGSYADKKSLFESMSAKEIKIRDPLCSFKSKEAKPLRADWMEEKTDEKWMKFLEEKEIALGRDPKNLLQKEITLDMFKKNIETFMEISSVVTIEWANEVSDAFFGKKENSKYVAAFGMSDLLKSKTIEEYEKEQQKVLVTQRTANIREKKKKEKERYERNHDTTSQFRKQLKELPVFLPGEGISFVSLPEDEKRYPVPFYYLSPLVLATSLHLDVDGKNYYFFNVKDNLGSLSCNLVFPGIAHGSLFRNYRKVGKISGRELGNAYQSAAFYGKKFAGKACTECTREKAHEFSKMYDAVVLNEIQFYDVLRPYLPPDFNKKSKMMQLLPLVNLSFGVTIRHQKEREDGARTETVLMDLIRALLSGFETAEKLEPLEQKISECEKSLFDLEMKEALGETLSVEETSQKKKLEEDKTDLSKKRDPLASKLKRCREVLEKRESYIKGLMEMIRIYKTSWKICRVELDGTIIEDGVADPFSGSSSPFLNSFLTGTTTAKQNQNNSAGQPNGVPGVGRPRSGSVSSRTHATKTKAAATGTKNTTDPAPKKTNINTMLANLCARIAAPKKTVPEAAPKGGVAGPAAVSTYQDRVQKWEDNGRKIKYVSSTGVVSEHIQPDEKVRDVLPLSSSDPKTAKALKKGEEANKEAVELLILNGTINIVEEKDPTGAGTGKYYVRFPTHLQ